MPRLLKETGLEIVTSFPYVLAEMGRADFWIPAIESFRRLVPLSGLMSAEDIGTWADASWAIDFYLRNGFTLVPNTRKESLLRRYWSVPARQIETSVVLADEKWKEALCE